MTAKHTFTNIKTSDLIPYARNSRTHSKEQVAQIAASIKEFGFTNPVLIGEDNVLIAGHGRLLAAQKLGLDDVPAVVIKGLSDTQKRALVLADNRLALSAGWDDEMLALEFQALKDEDYDLALTGFDEDEISKFVTAEHGWGQTDEDEVPEPPVTPVTVLGDVWLLGSHRLMCGDSTSIDAVEKLMDGKKADMVFTDPPYGVSIGDKNAFLDKMGKKGGRCVTNIENDTLSPEALYPLLVAVFKNVHSVLNNCGAVYVCSPQGGGLGMMMMMMKDSGLECRHILNWIKNSPTFSLGRLDYDYQHEPIMFTWKKTHKKIMKGDHKTSCWFVDKPRESKLHPTMKPVELPKNALLNSSDAGDVAFEPFGGAGSTLIASEMTGRLCRAMELDPKYVDVIIKRWQDFTGLDATHAETGSKFNDLTPKEAAA